jgi:hypothetical protein
MSDDPRSNRAPETPVEPNQEKSPKPWFLATRFVVIVASVLVLAIVGTVVGVSAHNASVTASLAAQQAAAKRADAAKKKLSLDCPEYASLSEAKRAAEADKLTPPTVTFNSIGTTTPSSVDFYDSVCKSASPGTSLEMLSKEVAQQYPSCRDFLKLPVAVQNSWSAATWQLWGTTQFTLEGTQQTPALIMGCQAPDAVPNATLQDSARALVLFMATHSDSGALASYLAGQADSVPTATPSPSPAPASSHSATWSFSNSQNYTYDMTLSLGELIKGSAAAGVAHPDEPKFVVGANCPIDAVTDAVIPGSMTVTATTVGFATPISARFRLTDGGSDLNSRFDGKISVDVDYGQCFALNSENYSLTGGVGVTWQTPFTKGESGRMNFFIIIHDYYSPANPNGDTGYLSGEEVVPDLGGTNTSQAEIDKIYRPIANSVQGITLSGQVVPN